MKSLPTYIFKSSEMIMIYTKTTTLYYYYKQSVYITIEQKCCNYFECEKTTINY